MQDLDEIIDALGKVFLIVGLVFLIVLVAGLTVGVGLVVFEAMRGL